VKFRIEGVFTVEGTAGVMARQIEPGDFSISPSSRLGGVRLQQFLDIPRKLKRPDGSLDLEIFAFTLADPADSSRLSKNDVVELVP